MLEPTEILRETARMSFRNRTALKLVIPSLVLDVILTTLIGYGAVHLHTVTSQAEYISCHSGNLLRAREKLLWEYVAKETQPKVLTPADRVSYAAFQAFLDKTMTLRDCKKL